MPTTTLVIPCYNEAERLNVDAFRMFALSDNTANLLLVNDGSRDETLSILNAIRAAAPHRVTVLDLPKNSGKAEAVRLGMLSAIETGSEFVGFWDADLATPFDALPAFVQLLRERSALDVVIGSRVRLLGRSIERRAVRHYAGRVFATAASLTLQLPVYDTQCGAKLFRASPRLKMVLGTPFLSKWVFDVEIIARFGALSSRYTPGPLREMVYEYPLHEWRDIKGSKLRTRDFLKAALDLLRIYRAYIGPRGSSKSYPRSAPIAPTEKPAESASVLR